MLAVKNTKNIFTKYIQIVLEEPEAVRIWKKGIYVAELTWKTDKSNLINHAQ